LAGAVVCVLADDGFAGDDEGARRVGLTRAALLAGEVTAAAASGN
jgi:hypothetical protein